MAKVLDREESTRLNHREEKGKKKGKCVDYDKLKPDTDIPGQALQERKVSTAHGPIIKDTTSHPGACDVWQCK
jgi:hypothetical protein